MRNLRTQGLTIIEILVVIAILGIIFAITIPQFAKMRENQVLKSTVGDVISSLDKARAETLSSLNSSVYGVHFQSDQIIIFKGASFSSGDANNETISITTPAYLANGSLTLPANIYFNRLSGSPSANGTITVSTTNYSKIITISATGTASVN